MCKDMQRNYVDKSSLKVCWSASRSQTKEERTYRASHTSSTSKLPLVILGAVNPRSLESRLNYTIKYISQALRELLERVTDSMQQVSETVTNVRQTRWDTTQSTFGATDQSMMTSENHISNLFRIALINLSNKRELLLASKFRKSPAWPASSTVEYAPS